MNSIRNLIINFHESCYKANDYNKYKRNKKYILWFLANVGFRFARIPLIIYLWLYKWADKYPEPLDNRNEGIIVSLTSFPARINTVWMGIESIMKQTVRPSKIILYLTEEEFPYKRKGLPRRLLNYEKLGLEICFRPYNLMPHNKYFYALQEYPDHDVITVDDDLYYHPDTIGNLVRIHQQHPNCICANTIRVVGFDAKGKRMPYKDWREPTKPVEPSLGYIALGYSGIYYPAGIFKKRNVFDTKRIRELALRVDDLWLCAHELIERIPIANGTYRAVGITIIGSQKIALKYDNDTKRENNGNNRQWAEICKFYGLTKNDFTK